MKPSRAAFAAVLVVCVSVAAQAPAHARRLIVNLPPGISTDQVWMQSTIHGDARAAIKTSHPSGSQLVLPLENDAHDGKLIVYVPSCKIQTYTLDLRGTADIVESFACDSLPQVTIHGFIPPQEIPHTIIAKNKFDIVGEFESGAMCEFLLTRHYGNTIIAAGVCQESPIEIGKVGELDPAGGGRFDITVPDFARDPFLTGRREASTDTNPGTVGLTLHEQRLDRPSGVIVPVGDKVIEGLQVRNEYPNPVTFTNPLHQLPQ